MPRAEDNRPPPTHARHAKRPGAGQGLQEPTAIMTTGCRDRRNSKPWPGLLSSSRIARGGATYRTANHDDQVRASLYPGMDRHWVTTPMTAEGRPTPTSRAAPKSVSLLIREHRRGAAQAFRNQERILDNLPPKKAGPAWPGWPPCSGPPEHRATCKGCTAGPHSNQHRIRLRW